MLKSRIFITGGKGMLASEIEAFYAAKGCEVLAPTRKELDVTDSISLEQAICSYNPRVIFHTAALFPDFCEDNIELAFKVNTWATQNIARLCQKINSVLVNISTCGLFGDEIKYYSEYDPVVLKTVYARSKYLAENIAEKECVQTYNIRAGWLFGGSKHHKRNFVYQRYLEVLNSPESLNAAGDKYGSPTYTVDLISKIDEILEKEVPGVYHITNAGGATRADYVKKILDSFGLKTKLNIVDSSCFPRKANVPNCEMLTNMNLKYLGLELLPPWQEAVEKFVQLMRKAI